MKNGQLIATKLIGLYQSEESNDLPQKLSDLDEVKDAQIWRQKKKKKLNFK